MAASKRVLQKTTAAAAAAEGAVSGSGRGRHNVGPALIEAVCGALFGQNLPSSY